MLVSKNKAISLQHQRTSHALRFFVLILKYLYRFLGKCQKISRNKWIRFVQFLLICTLMIYRSMVNTCATNEIYRVDLQYSPTEDHPRW